MNTPTSPGLLLILLDTSGEEFFGVSIFAIFIRTDGYGGYVFVDCAIGEDCIRKPGEYSGENADAACKASETSPGRGVNRFLAEEKG